MLHVFLYESVKTSIKRQKMAQNHPLYGENVLFGT